MLDIPEEARRVDAGRSSADPARIAFVAANLADVLAAVVSAPASAETRRLAG